MRSELNKIDMNGEVVIGEGSLDEAPCFIQVKNLEIKMDLF